MHAHENIDVKSITQRLFALSKKNRFSLPVNNLAQAEMLITDLLGITNYSGVRDQCLEAEVNSLVESARADGYSVLREYDEDTNKLAYLEIVARGAKRSQRTISAIPYQELQSRLDALPVYSKGEIIPARVAYKECRLALGQIKNRNPLKMKESLYGTGRRMIISLGDAGVGHLQRACSIIGQAAQAGWAISAYDFIPEKGDFLGALNRMVDASKRNVDIIVQDNPAFGMANVDIGSVGLLGSLESPDDWSFVLFNREAEMNNFANLLSLISHHHRKFYPGLQDNVDWMETYETLDNILGLISDPRVGESAPLIEKALLAFLGVSTLAQITFEESDFYCQHWAKWIAPFIQVARAHQKISSACHVGLNDVMQARRISYAGVSLDFNGRHELFNRAYYNYLKHYNKAVQGTEKQALVALRVSGSSMQDPLVMGMVRLFIGKQYQVVLIVDGQTQKAALIAQKLAMAGHAECLWHTCHINKSAALPLDLNKATAGQCLWVNRERIKEPLLLLPSN
ncbi:MAG: hypothetical protein RSD49_01450 [Hafnia sp.]